MDRKDTVIAQIPSYALNEAEINTWKAVSYTHLNSKFRDHYLELPLDLSDVLFVTTANTLQTIPRPLLDRMEVIEITSYTENEKLHIAEEHLIPKQLKKHGLDEKQVKLSRHALEKLIHSYTREAGVRQLERKIGDICRKSAKEILETKKKRINITEKNPVSYTHLDVYKRQKKYHLYISK